MEDELASMAAIIGGSLAGKKSMTATNGPGFFNAGKHRVCSYYRNTLCCCKCARGGPSTGLPTSPAQGDVMQASGNTRNHPAMP